MDNTKLYTPIDCSFYDYLEAAATLKTVSVIEYAENNSVLKVESWIKTLFSKNKVEFMELENRQTIRLDNLIKFNGKPLPKSC